MTDVALLAVIVAFFGAAALLVRVLDRMIVRTSGEAAPGDEAEDEAPGIEFPPGRPA